MAALWALGLVIGVLSSGTGLGGGFLVVPYLLSTGYTAKLAVGTSVCFVLLVATSSVAAHYREGNVDIKTGLLLATGGIIGAQFGPAVLNHVPDEIFKKVFGIMMMGLGGWLAFATKA
jgi:uncharacterized protein